jgi:chromosome partitioning protein
MPVISFATTKGGAGKTTATMVAASVLTDAGATVSVLDADPNQPFVTWAQLGKLPANLKVVGGINHQNILDVIEAEAASSKFVLIDTEGSANLALNYAMSQSHLVVIPCQASDLDAKEAGKTIKLVSELRRTSRAVIDAVMVWQRTNAAGIESRNGKSIRRQFEEARIPCLETKLVEREPFKSMYSYGRTLQDLGQIEDISKPSLEKAQANAHAFVEEILNRIKSVRGGQHDRAA